MAARVGWRSGLWLVVAGGVVAGAAYGLALTERMAVRAVVAAPGDVVPALEVDAGGLDPAGEGRLVHTVGMLGLPMPVTDRDFEVQFRAAKLVRQSEMFQWKADGGRYETVWSAEPIDSAGFTAGHANPLFGRRSLVLTAPRGRVGALAVDYAAIGQLTTEEAVTLDPPPKGAVADGEWLFYGADKASPQVGDLRVRYAAVWPGVVSVLGQQVQDGLRPFPLGGGRSLLVMRAGRVDAAAMREETGGDQGLAVWGMRAAAWVGLLVGFRLSMGPLAALGAARAARRPWLSEVMATGPFLIALAGAVLVGSLLTGAVWVRARPFQGAWVIGVGLLAEGLMVRTIRARRDWLRPVEYTPHRVAPGAGKKGFSQF